MEADVANALKFLLFICFAEIRAKRLVVLHLKIPKLVLSKYPKWFPVLARSCNKI